MGRLGSGRHVGSLPGEGLSLALTAPHSLLPLQMTSPSEDGVVRPAFLPSRATSLYAWYKPSGSWKFWVVPGVCSVYLVRSLCTPKPICHLSSRHHAALSSEGANYEWTLVLERSFRIISFTAVGMSRHQAQWLSTPKKMQSSWAETSPGEELTDELGRRPAHSPSPLVCEHWTAYQLLSWSSAHVILKLTLGHGHSRSS